jgi:tetratricopeptide (TPR) repeat protein
MPSIDLKIAVAKIHQTIKQRQKRGLPSPFFFIVGAGISHPEIPLANRIEEECKKEAEEYRDTIPPKSNAAIDTYSHWFSKAYPSAEERKVYLRGLMEKKTISKANLRLAHLVLDGTVARTVFTPNFDDMLTRALTLFGQRPLVCDHPLTVGRMRIESSDIQIIHVHGSYWFYDCCNLTDEMAERSISPAMKVMLDQSLRDHSPLVVGYSGWEGDIIMSALKRRLDAGGLGTPIYWFCYRKESMDALPGWLKDHRDVYFVLPDTPVPTTVSAATLQSTETGPEVSISISGTTKAGDSISGGKDSGLRADSIFDAMVNYFNIPAPPLTKNPLSFYAAQLKELLGTRDNEPDPYYSFRTVVERVERASKAEEEKAPETLQSLRDAMSKADYRGAIRVAGKVEPNTLSADEKREAASVLLAASFGLNDNSSEEIAGYDLVVKLGNLQERSGTIDSRARKQVAMALFNKGITLGTINKSEEAIAVYDDLLRRFGDAQELELRRQVAMALVNKGYRLGVLNKSEEAIAVYDDLVGRFGDAQEPALREQVAKALFNKGFRLGVLNKSEEEIAVYDDLVGRFGDAQEPALREQVAMVLVNKGYRLGVLNKSEEAIAVYDDLLRRFGDAQEPAIREQVAKALFNKGCRLGALNRSEEGIAVYDDLARRFGDAQEPTIRQQVVKALVNKGIAFELLDNKVMAMNTYEEIIARYKEVTEETVAGIVTKARKRLEELRGGGAPPAAASV